MNTYLGKNHFFLENFSKSIFFSKAFWENCHLEKLFFQKVRFHFWRSSEKIVTCTPWSRYMFRTFFLEGTQRWVFTELIYNDVSRGHSAIMQTIQVTIRGQSGWMWAANHNTCNGNNPVHPRFYGALRPS